MTVGGALILYATAVGLAGAAGFRRAVWPLRAPRLGAAVVLAAAWSVPVAFVLAGVTIILPPSALFTDLGHLAGACLDRLRAAYGTPAEAGIITAGQVLSLALLARLVWAVRRRPSAADAAAPTPAAAPAGRRAPPGRSGRGARLSRPGRLQRRRTAGPRSSSPAVRSNCSPGRSSAPSSPTSAPT